MFAELGGSFAGLVGATSVCVEEFLKTFGGFTPKMIKPFPNILRVSSFVAFLTVIGLLLSGLCGTHITELRCEYPVAQGAGRGEAVRLQRGADAIRRNG